VRSDWLAPVSHGSLLPDFALEGPVDLFLSQPTALQLFMPHASDAGTVRRVLLREGAAVLVRGARVVRLREGLDLPPISLSEFAGGMWSVCCLRPFARLTSAAAAGCARHQQLVHCRRGQSLSMRLACALSACCFSC
jgi:hypothetical protein